MRSDSVSSFMYSVSSPLNPEIRTEIEDLEQTIKLNKLILEELLGSLSLSRSSKELSYDTEVPQLISAKIYQTLKTENEILSNSQKRINIETKQGKVLILQAEEQANRCKNRKKESISKLQIEKFDIRKEIESKEEAIQKLEKYGRSIEADIEDTNKETNDDPNLVIKETRKLIKAVENSLVEAKNERHQEIERCKELEEEMKRLSGTIKASVPEMNRNAKDISREHNWLFLNYENYWFENNNLNENRASTVSGPELDSSLIEKKIEEETLEEEEDNDTTELLKLEIAYKMECEEMTSLQRIMDQMKEQEHALANYLDMQIRKNIKANNSD